MLGPRSAPRLYPPTTDTSLYTPTPSHYLAGRTSVAGAPMAGVGVPRQYSLRSNQKAATMWDQPAPPWSPPPFRPHSEPDHGQRLAAQFPPGYPSLDGTPTRLPPQLRAAAGTHDIAGGSTTALRFLVVPPDRYSPVRGGNRGRHDVRLPNSRAQQSRARAQAPLAAR